VGFGSWIAALKMPLDLLAFVVFAMEGKWPLSVMFFGFFIAGVGITWTSI
jgi:hypothetical protein